MLKKSLAANVLS